MTKNGEEARVGREYPQAPIVGVAAVVLRDWHVLLIRRGRQPMLGAWSLPGGALELGETTADGVAREVFEETGVRVRPVEIIATLDRITRDGDGRVRYHYVLVEWLCLAEGESHQLVCGDDAVEARWIKRGDISSEEYDLGASTLEVLERALKLAEMMER